MSRGRLFRTRSRSETLAALICVAVAVSAVAHSWLAGALERPPSADAPARVTIDTRTTFQTITGWEATAWAGQGNPAFHTYKDELFELAANDLGINRLRLEVRSGVENSRDYWQQLQEGLISGEQWRPVRYATVNDNADPFSIDERGFSFSELDDTVRRIVVPMQQRLARSGRRLLVNVNYVAFTEQIGDGLSYDHKDPEEYAEFVQATYRHLAQTFGLVPDSWEIILEPDNSTRYWRAGLVRQAMVAAGNRLQAMGVTPRFIAPSTTKMANAVAYADEIARGGAPLFWAELSYHRYYGVSDRNLRAIAKRARELGIGTSMLEHMGSGYASLHADLKVGQNTAWQQYALGGVGKDTGGTYYLVNTSDPARPRISPAAYTRFFRQYFRYIHPGAVRIDAVSDQWEVDPLAFVNPDGTHVVVMAIDRPSTIIIEGLRPGTYQATATAMATRELPVEPDAADASVTVRVPDRGVVTIFGSTPSETVY